MEPENARLFPHKLAVCRWHVSEGVADYVQPGSGLLYSVPYGDAAGIWLARAK